MDSYCGKDCGLCPSREQLGCSGCADGMGRRFGGPCEIAACCREKGHDRCATCGYRTGCPRLAGRDEVPRRETRRRALERARDEELARQAPLLGKWLWLLFWLVVPRLISGLMTADWVEAAFPAVGRVGAVLGFLCALAYGLFLWPLGSVRKGYRTAALCQLLITAEEVVLALLPGEENPLLLLLGLLSLGLGLYRNYLEFNTHADVLSGLDSGLSDSWRKLWKWNVWALSGMAGSILAAWIAAPLGWLLLLGSAIAVAALSVVEMVYLWRTAKMFREHRAPALPEPPGL